MDGEAALDIVQETEVLARLFERDDVHEAGWVGVVGADLAVNFDKSLCNDQGDFATRQSVLELVAEEDLNEQRRSCKTHAYPDCQDRAHTDKGKDSRNLCGPGLGLGA